MNKLVLFGALFTGLTSHAQTTLFQDNFEAGTGNWTLNGGAGNNQWLWNNEYAGYPGLIGDTPNQPGTFTGGVNSSYLHITNSDICVVGICNANFDTGSSSNQPLTQTTGISTTGYSNVTLDFWYVCAGLSGTSYGFVEYSTDGGSNWAMASGQYSGVTAWSHETITLPAFNNQASLKFRFVWQNGNAGNDPAFSIDEVKITGTAGGVASLATGAITATTYCSNTTASISVPFTVSGTVNAGNVYTAQLSNSAGSFASPTAIGTLASSATGSLTISATIPSGLPAGTGYRIRVDASSPAATGTDNGTNLSVSPPPTVGITSVPANGVICNGNTASLTASGGTSFLWSPAGSLSSSTNQNVTASPASTQMYTLTGTDANGCSNSATFTVTVQNCAGLAEESLGIFALYPNPANQTLYLNFGELQSVRSVRITDLSGRTVLTAKTNSTSLDIHELESGKYFLWIEHASGSAVQSFLKD